MYYVYIIQKCPLASQEGHWKTKERINIHNISTTSPATFEIPWGQCSHVP